MRIMKIYQIQIRKSVKKDLELIKNFVVEKTDHENAIKYAAELYAEIESLTYLADYIKVSEWKTGNKFSVKEKILITKNRKWSIFFHVYRNIVIVDMILPSKMVKE